MGPLAQPEELAGEFAETARAISAAGVAVEVNASGVRKGCGAPFPHPDLLRRCLEAGVPVAYGSDAHDPAEVGHARDLAAAALGGVELWRPRERSVACAR